MACQKDDREGAVREVTRVYEVIKTHKPLLLHDHHQGQQDLPSTTQLVQRLLGEALQALNIALSGRDEDMGEELQKKEARTYLSMPAIEGGKNSSWVKLTPFLYDDGYEWRKYGEKKINGANFTKCYFRCTYKDDKGCLATKYVQQKDNTDPPVFQVTYNNDHTCNSNINNNLPTGGAAALSNPPAIAHHDVVVVQKEATAALPPLADVSAIPLDDLMPCDEPFPTADQCVNTVGAVGDNSCIPVVSCDDELDMGWIMTEPLIGDEPFPTADQCVTVGAVGDNSCIPVASCDELDMGWIMTEPLIGGDPELQDQDLLLLWNSFKYW
ncbi:hypothetical protein PR202_gb16592 [Eleusine coracana subsp. coracana]|uniref:WRKY domain-containing protein n=1 Tax=Eleusine coracana subsp. coracana TaxID=191504 RepID=A0AAV5F1W7_ELECO|nr:hypothetical protein PR202_gb16592 [Eleusine coracana subsp. coracana]